MNINSIRSPGSICSRSTCATAAGSSSTTNRVRDRPPARDTVTACPDSRPADASRWTSRTARAHRPKFTGGAKHAGELDDALTASGGAAIRVTKASPAGAEEPYSETPLSSLSTAKRYTPVADSNNQPAPAPATGIPHCRRRAGGGSVSRGHAASGHDLRFLAPTPPVVQSAPRVEAMLGTRAHRTRHRCGTGRRKRGNHPTPTARD
jgi:hypothetical protein